MHVKLVAESGVGTVAAGVSKAHADVVLISGHDGGTGASPLTSLKHAGVPWELGLAETQQVLLMNRLRDRIVVQVDGQMKTGRDVVVAALLGAEEFGFATAPLVVMGCVMMRVCHLNTCPVGIATQDPELRKTFNGKPEFVQNFFQFIAEEVRELMAALGFRTLDQMIGRAECIDFEPAKEHWKAHGLDLVAGAVRAEIPTDNVARRNTYKQDAGLAHVLDHQLIEGAMPALDHRAPVEMAFADSQHRSHRRHDARLRGDASVSAAPDCRTTRFASASPDRRDRASARSSRRGITLALEGEANDFVGKGLSGGRLIVRPPRNAAFAAEENVIIGNVALYGATSGEAFISGIAGERFAVRNSGAHAVVEGVGDHALRVHDGRPRDRARPDRPQLRRRHERRHRLRARYRRLVRAQLQHRHGRPRAARSARRGRAGARPDRAARRADRQRDRRSACSMRGRSAQRQFVAVMPRDFKRVKAAEAKARSESREPVFSDLVA